MKTRVLALALLLALPVTASAQEEAAPTGRLRLQTRTLILARDSVPGVLSEFPVYQWLELTGHDLARPGLSVSTSIWGFGALDSNGMDEVTGERVAGDVDLLYVQYLDPKGHFGARAGRQLVMAGPGAGFYGHIDGGWLRGAVGDFDLQAYGGHVVRSRFANLDQADWLAGGRLGYRAWSRANGGVSFLQVSDDGETARQMAGADLTVGLMDGFDLAAYGSFDLISEGVAEAALLARYTPIRPLTVSLSARQASPGRLIDQTSIFSVFSLGDYMEGGAEVQYAFTEQWVASAEYARVFFPGADGTGTGEEANRFGAHVTTFPRRDLWLRFGVNRLPAADNGYTSGRIAARWQPLAQMSASADLLAYFYDDPPLSVAGAGTESLFGRLFGDYQVSPGLMVGLGGELAQTVASDVDARALLRVTWSAEFELGGGR